VLYFHVTRLALMKSDLYAVLCKIPSARPLVNACFRPVLPGGSSGWHDSGAGRRTGATEAVAALAGYLPRRATVARSAFSAWVSLVFAAVVSEPRFAAGSSVPL